MTGLGEGEIRGALEGAKGLLGFEAIGRGAVLSRWADPGSFRLWRQSGGCPGGAEIELLTPLEEPTALLARYLETSRSIYCLVATLQGAIVATNSAIERLLGFGKSELAGRSLWDCLTEAGAESVRKRVNGEEESRNASFLLNFLDRNRLPRTVACRIELLPGTFAILGQALPKLYETVGRGLMELNNELVVLLRENARKGAEADKANQELRTAMARLEEERLLLEHVVEQMPAGVIVTEAEGAKVLLSNRKASEIWGAHAIEAPANPSEVVPPREIDVKRSDGTRATVLAGSTPVLRGGNRDAVARVITLLDITERKDTERKLRRLNESLHALAWQLLRSGDRDRRELYRKLHEETAQNIAALGLHLAALASEDQARSEPLSRAAGLVQRCLWDLEELSRHIHPPLLEELGLTAALETFAKRFAESSGIRVDVLFAGDAGASAPDLQIALFRIVEEALENVRRHSGSPEAAVRLQRGAEGIILEIEDYGRGLPAEEEARPAGTGIPTMGERAGALGGRLEIESRPGRTALRFVFPSPELRSTR